MSRKRTGTRPECNGQKNPKTIKDFQPDRFNANKGTPRGLQMVEDSLRKYGAGRSILADKHGRIIAGNKTLQSASDIDLPIRVVETDGKELVVVQRTDLDLTDAKARELAVADNRSSQVGLDWDAEVLSQLKDEGVELSGMFTEKELSALLSESGHTIDESAARLTLSERFIVPPFSVLDARQGYWQDRKRAWIALGIRSELGRGANQLDMSASSVGVTDERERERWNEARRSSHKSVLRKSDVGRLAGAKTEAKHEREGAGEGERLNRTRSRFAVSPGGWPRPAMKLKNGHTVRGDGRGREI